MGVGMPSSTQPVNVHFENTFSAQHYITIVLSLAHPGIKKRVNVNNYILTVTLQCLLQDKFHLMQVKITTTN